MSPAVRVVSLAVTILILTLLQVGVLPTFFGYFPSLNFFLPLSLALCFKEYYKESLWFAFLSGTTWDLFLFSPFGLSCALLVFLVWFFRAISRFLGGRWVVFIGFCFVSSLLWRAIFGFPSFSYLYLIGAVGDLLLACFSALLVVPIWEKIFGKKDLQLSMEIR